MQEYTVKAGDTLSKIAQKKGVKTSELIALNLKHKFVRDENNIYTGQKILIPNKKTSKKSANRQEQGEQIALTAQKHLHTKGMQCKAFVQKIIYEGTGVWVPRNHPDRKHKHLWDNVRSHKQIKKVDLTRAKKGDILQILWKDTVIKSDYPWHTAIFLSKDEDKMTWIDSNWQGYEIVNRHDVGIEYFIKTMEKCSVYRIYA